MGESKSIYSDPSEQRLVTQGGRSVAEVLPSRSRLRGSVVPVSSSGGAAPGRTTNPGKVIIDPHVPGESPVELDIAKLTEDRVVDAFNTADGDDIRKIAYNTFRQLAGKGNLHIEGDNMERPVVPTRQPVNATLLPKAPIGIAAIAKPASFSAVVAEEVQPVQLSAPNTITIERPRSSLPPSAFLMKERPRESMARQILTHDDAHDDKVQSPDCSVIFEIEAFGTFETAYHKVVQSDDGLCLVLVYDTRFKAGTKYFPRKSDHEIFVDVPSLSCVFKVHSPGLIYKVDDLEHCVLLVADRAVKDSDDE